MNTPLLYLDFDGVLHPGNVHIDSFGRPYLAGPTLSEAGRHRLFEWVDVLIAELDPYPELRIVLSTTWAVQLGMERARSRLPITLQDRVIGSTFEGHMQTATEGASFRRLPRGEQVLRDVDVRRPTRWLAIDDVDAGWGAAADHLVLCNGMLGLGDVAARISLQKSLARMANSPQ